MPSDAPAAELSPLDRRILRTLQRDGRISNASLAREVGLGPAACWTHTKRLFERGAVRGVRAVLAPEAVGRGTLVLVGVVLDRSAPESFAAFGAAVRAMEQVLDCVLAAGEVDYFLRVRVCDSRRSTACTASASSPCPGCGRSGCSS